MAQLEAELHMERSRSASLNAEKRALRAHLSGIVSRLRPADLAAAATPASDGDPATAVAAAVTATAAHPDAAAAAAAGLTSDIGKRRLFGRDDSIPEEDDASGEVKGGQHLGSLPFNRVSLDTWAQDGAQQQLRGRQSSTAGSSAAATKKWEHSAAQPGSPDRESAATDNHGVEEQPDSLKMPITPVRLSEHLAKAADKIDDDNNVVALTAEAKHGPRWPTMMPHQ